MSGRCFVNSAQVTQEHHSITVAHLEKALNFSASINYTDA